MDNQAAPFDVAKVQEVIVTTLRRRGEGRGGDPIRVLTQYWSRDGKLLAEVDPWTQARESLLAHEQRERIKNAEDLREGMRQRVHDLMAMNEDLEQKLAEAKRQIAMLKGAPSEFDDAFVEIIAEAESAKKTHGPLRSAHEGWGVLREEVRELEEVFMLKDHLRDAAAGRLEAKQVAAVALRIMLDVFPVKPVPAEV